MNKNWHGHHDHASFVCQTNYLPKNSRLRLVFLFLEEAEDLLDQSLGAGVAELFLDHFDQLVDLLIGQVDAELLFERADGIFGEGREQVLVARDALDEGFSLGFQLFKIQFVCHDKTFFLH